MKHAKKLLLTSTITALMTAACVIPLEAYAAKAEFSFSGQISRAISQVDNGIDTDTLHVDNNNSGTRLRLKGQTDLGNGTTAGVYWETQYQDNSSSSQDINDPDNASAFTSRIREVWFSGDWGKVYLGQGNGAANGTSEVDFSGTSIADYSGNNLDDGISFVGTATVKNGSAFSNFDGLSRNDRLRYDLPKFGSVGLAFSTGQERFESALRYSQKLGDGGKFGLAVGQVTDDIAMFDQLGISASLMLSSGLNFTVHVGDKDNDTGRDPSGTYLKVGQKFGANNISLSFHSVDDNAALGDEAERVNLSYVHNLAKHGVELFASFQTSSLDRPGETFEDVTQIAVGSRIKFQYYLLQGAYTISSLPDSENTVKIKNITPVFTKLRYLIASALILISTATCQSIEPGEPLIPAGDEMPGPGLFSGESGEFKFNSNVSQPANESTELIQEVENLDLLETSKILEQKIKELEKQKKELELLMLKVDEKLQD